MQWVGFLQLPGLHPAAVSFPLRSTTGGENTMEKLMVKIKAKTSVINYHYGQNRLNLSWENSVYCQVTLSWMVKNKGKNWNIFLPPPVFPRLKFTSSFLTPLHFPPRWCWERGMGFMGSSGQFFAAASSSHFSLLLGWQSFRINLLLHGSTKGCSSHQKAIQCGLP